MRSLLSTIISALTLLLTASVAPAFDECATAVPMGIDFTGGPFSLSGLGGTDGGGDPIRSCTGEPGHNTLWATITPPTDGIFYLSGDANLTVYAGTCGALTELACAMPSGGDSALLTGGQTYYLELSGPPDLISYTTVLCGDGNPMFQQCDDGNLIDTDGCTNECAFNYCGDGSLYIGVEECDDGNLVNGDGCESNCTTPGCGNGVEEGPEECDDGNGLNTDPCTNTCLDNVCGDGFVNTGVEQCDDGNFVDGDGCESDCRLPSNDDCVYATPVPPPPMLSFVNLTGATNQPSDPVHSCSGQQGPHNRWFTYAVQPAVTGRLLVASSVVVSVYTGTCGAFVEVACQSVPQPSLVPFVANVTGGQTYHLELSGPEITSPLFVSVCGDGVREPPMEQCDDANDVDLDGCSNICLVPACGDGTVQSGEQCDDGNLLNSDGCEDDCFVTSSCGDGAITGHETCDDGNLIDDDGCGIDCRLPCPDDLCKCLGAAAQFTAVGGKLVLKNGKFSEDGETEFVPTEVEGNVCGLTATFSAKPGGESNLTGDLILTAPTEYAGVFKGYKDVGLPQPGTFVLGDLATGGGLVKGAPYVDVAGVTDTSGLHLLVSQCTQAAIDVAGASATLAALTPTLALAEIQLSSGEEQTVIVGPGRQIVSVPEIKLKGYTSELEGALLTFVMQPTTEVLVVNVPKLSLGAGAEILIEEGGNGGYAIINVPGDSGKVTIKKEASLGAPLLAPHAKVQIPDGAFTDAIYTTAAMKLQGATLSSSLECEE